MGSPWNRTVLIRTVLITLDTEECCVLEFPHKKGAHSKECDIKMGEYRVMDPVNVYPEGEQSIQGN